MHVKLRQQNPGTIDPDDIIYMRSSEMYLIEAEARAYMGDLEGAREALAPLASERDEEWDGDDYQTEEEFIEHIKFQRGLRALRRRLPLSGQDPLGRPHRPRR